MMIWLHFAILIVSIALGSRIGGVGLGTVAGAGLAGMVFVLGVAPGKLPVDVIFIILTVITAASALQSAGGLDLLVEIAGKAMRKRPRAITFVAPLLTYTLTLLCGTEHVVYSLLPVIAEVARGAGVRPERPLSISVVAAQQAITASPISAATATILTLLGASAGIGLPDILKVVIPATLMGVFAGALSVAWRGKELSEEMEYQKRLSDGAIAAPVTDIAMDAQQRKHATWAVIIFLSAAATIVLLGLYPNLRPMDGAATPKRIAMAPSIEIVMLLAAALIMWVGQVKPEDVVSSRVMRAGCVALVSIFGIAWLGSTFFEANRQAIVGSISHIIEHFPWVFAFGLFVLSIFLYSQAATTAALLPVGIQLGIAPALLIGMFPAVNGFFFFPTYGTVVAAINFDQTGTTRVGRFMIDHSFLRPEIVATTTSVITGLLLARVVG